MPFAAVRRRALHRKRMASSLDNPAWLDWMSTLIEGASRQSCAATFPADRYYCLLDELPLHLLSPRGRELLRVHGGDPSRMVLSSDCILCSDGRVPDELSSRTESFSRFAEQGTIGWVREPRIGGAEGSLLPYWLTPQLAEMLGRLRAGEAAPPQLPRESVAALSGAGIFVRVDQADERAVERRISTGRSSLQFREKGYAPIPSLIHPFHVAALRRYYRQLIRTGEIQLGDTQCAGRYAAYNDPVARFFHYQLAAVLSAIAGEPLKPSYVYFASYLGGAELKKHVDREQCEFSVTLCLDFSPEPVLETPWPIHLETPTGRVTMRQALGDGLMYRGTRLPHWREVLSDGQTSTSIFFHYVAADFNGTLD